MADSQAGNAVTPPGGIPAIQPIGSQVGTATVGGRTWQVWSGNNGSDDVLSFVAPSAIGSWSFAERDGLVRQAVPVD